MCRCFENCQAFVRNAFHFREIGRVLKPSTQIPLSRTSVFHCDSCQAMHGTSRQQNRFRSGAGRTVEIPGAKPLLTPPHPTQFEKKTLFRFGAQTQNIFILPFVVFRKRTGAIPGSITRTVSSSRFYESREERQKQTFQRLWYFYKTDTCRFEFLSCLSNLRSSGAGGKQKGLVKMPQN